MLFLVLDFALQPKSRTRILKTQKKVAEISEFLTWPFINLPGAMKLSISLMSCPLTKNFAITSTN